MLALLLSLTFLARAADSPVNVAPDACPKGGKAAKGTCALVVPAQCQAKWKLRQDEKKAFSCIALKPRKSDKPAKPSCGADFAYDGKGGCKSEYPAVCRDGFVAQGDSCARLCLPGFKYDGPHPDGTWWCKHPAACPTPLRWSGAPDFDCASKDKKTKKQIDCGPGATFYKNPIAKPNASDIGACWGCPPEVKSLPKGLCSF